jgi:hypothetical protein|nr:MAG TPA: hypothetical protein [Caudoviricetes sp.]
MQERPYFMTNPSWYRFNDEDGEVELTENAPEKAVKSFQEFKKVEEDQFNQAKQLTEGCLDGMKK